MIQFTYTNPLLALVKGSSGSAGWDIKCAIPAVVSPYETKPISTGVTLKECPTDCYIRVAPRSGLSKKGINVFAGVVDSDYRGEIMVMIHNSSDKHIGFHVYDRIAQLIPTQLAPYKINGIVTPILNSPRGENGFGSSGV